MTIVGLFLLALKFFMQQDMLFYMPEGVPWFKFLKSLLL